MFRLKSTGEKTSSDHKVYLAMVNSYGRHIKNGEKVVLYEKSNGQFGVMRCTDLEKSFISLGADIWRIKYTMFSFTIKVVGTYVICGYVRVKNHTQVICYTMASGNMCSMDRTEFYEKFEKIMPMWETPTPPASGQIRDMDSVYRKQNFIDIGKDGETYVATVKRLGIKRVVITGRDFDLVLGSAHKIYSDDFVKERAS